MDCGATALGILSVQFYLPAIDTAELEAILTTAFNEDAAQTQGVMDAYIAGVCPITTDVALVVGERGRGCGPGRPVCVLRPGVSLPATPQIYMLPALAGPPPPSQQASSLHALVC